MSKFSKQLAATAVTAALSLPVMATNGILPLGNGMVAHGMGGAGIANGSEAMSGVDNPALLSRTSNQWAIGASLFSPLRSANIAGNYVDSESNYFIIPQGGYTSNINDKMDWALLVTALGGMNTDYPATLAGEQAGFDLSGLIIAPTFSYKIDSKSSVGVSLLIGYEMMETDGFAGGFGDNSDSATGTGFKFGYANDVAANTTIGVFYQTAIDMDEMDQHCTGDGAFAGFKAVGGDCSVDLPDMYGLGVVQKLNDTTKIVADLMQVNWSSVDLFDRAFGWEDQMIIKIGAEFKTDSTTAWRVGYNHGDSPIKDTHVSANVFAPAVTEDHYTVGYSKKMSSVSEINAYYAYVPENEQSQSGPVSGPGQSPIAKVKMSQHALGIGYNKRF